MEEMLHVLWSSHCLLCYLVFARFLSVWCCGDRQCFWVMTPHSLVGAMLQTECYTLSWHWIPQHIQSFLPSPCAHTFCSCVIMFFRSKVEFLCVTVLLAQPVTQGGLCVTVLLAQPVMQGGLCVTVLLAQPVTQGGLCVTVLLAQPVSS
jgi:hypothetical protein